MIWRLTNRVCLWWLQLRIDHWEKKIKRLERGSDE
jgi:hypothetical protein